VDPLAGGPVLGLFASGYMTTRYQPLVATAAGSGSTSYRCQPNDLGDQPSLAEMTTKALALVDNPNGFFMQVESAQTDKGAHDGNICGSLGQVLAADKALEVLLEYQRTHPDTLIVVTADHGHATQIVRPGEAKVYGTLQTADGDPLRVGYSTSTSGQWHTGTQVPVAAKGPQAANVTGTIDQTDLYDVLKGLAPAGTDVAAPVTTAAVATSGW
jgi:alkaline phosphatase